MAQAYISLGQRLVLAFFFGLGGLRGLRGLRGFHELASRMIPAANTGDTVGAAYLSVTGIAIGLQNAREVIEQSHRYSAASGWGVGKEHR